MIADGTGQKESMLPIIHNHHNFQKNVHLFEKICLVETLQNISPLCELPSFVGQVVVAIVIAINPVIGGFSKVDLI